jgi:hypothetical protein
MTREDYKYVSGDIGKIALGGELLPERYATAVAAAVPPFDGADAPPVKCSIVGEDIAYLMEAEARFWRIDRDVKPRSFTRSWLASQATGTVTSLSALFLSGRALKTLPDFAGQTIRLNSSNDVAGLFDVLDISDYEAPEPLPRAGGEIVTAPFLAAFRNYRKIKGQFIFFDYDSYPSSEVVYAQAGGYRPDNYSPAANRISFANQWFALKEPGQSSADRRGIRVVSGPTAWGDPWSYDGGAVKPLDGVRTLSGHIWRVSARFSSYPGTAEYSGSGAVVVFADSWHDEVFKKLNCSPLTSLDILAKLCNAIGVPWAMLSGDYSGIGDNQSAYAYAQADYLGAVGVCTIDSCLKG